VGLSTDHFHGTKIIGLTDESIGLSANGVVHFLKGDHSDASLKVDEKNLHNFRVCKGSVLGVGFLFYSKEVFFTKDGVLLRVVPLPARMENKALYPAFSLGSREQHRVKINLGLRKFQFDIDHYLQEKHYHKIYSKITRTNKPDSQTQRQHLNQSFHNLVFSFLKDQGYAETLNAIAQNAETLKLVRQFSGAKLAVSQEDQKILELRK
jgi:hypothetical protein